MLTVTLQRLRQKVEVTDYNLSSTCTANLYGFKINNNALYMAKIIFALI